MEFSDSVQLARMLLLIALLVVCSATDLSTRRIPNPVLLAALVSALFFNGLADGVSGVADSIAGLVIGLLLLLPLYVLGGMAAGDVKLLGVVGSILGAWGAVVAGLATMMAGALLGLAYIVWVAVRPGSDSRRSGPVGATSERGMEATRIRPAGIPYAIAIACGTLAALVYLDFWAGVIVT